ncbi:MAG: hypothetical protein R2813_12910 [Flavobacteriales bacterium]
MLLVSTTGFAQVANSDFQKLFDLYTMEDYAKCAYKAEKYSQKEKYRRDPEPYLYMALCFYQAHVHPEKFDQEFEDPLTDALKYAYKFRKKDKNGKLYQTNRVLLDKIREEALTNAKFMYNDGDYRKASSEFNRILKVVPDDVNLMFIGGVADIMSRNTAQGERKIGIAMDTLRAQRESQRFEEDPVTQEILIKAFVEYTNYLSENNQQDKAEEVIAFGRKLIPNDPTLKVQYKKIYAIIPKDEE